MHLYALCGISRSYFLLRGFTCSIASQTIRVTWGRKEYRGRYLLSSLVFHVGLGYLRPLLAGESAASAKQPLLPTSKGADLGVV